MMDRRIIFETRTGSHLYGTNTPTSDEDFQGVFLPSTEDLLGVQNCPSEWTKNEKVTDGDRNSKGDVDRKFYSLKRFFDLAAQGQPGQIELLFAPENRWFGEPSWHWFEILKNRHLFVSKTGIKPFLGFAVSQANKASIKGDNLNKIREMIAAIKPIVEKDSRAHIREHMEIDLSSRLLNEEKFTATVAGVELKWFKNEHGFEQVEIAGRQFDPGILLKSFLESLVTLEARYGTRSEAAAANKYDFKSLSHACRLIFEAEEFLKTGHVTLPRPEAQFLLDVKQGKVDWPWFEYLFGQIDRLEKEVLPASTLPAQPDRAKINQLCIDLHLKHLNS